MLDPEGARVAFLVSRDGMEATRAWCLETARSYRKVVLQRKTHTMYRRRLVESYLSLKAFALDVMTCINCDQPATTQVDNTAACADCAALAARIQAEES